MEDDIKHLRPLEDVTSLNPESFYTMYIQPNQAPCIQTDAKDW